MALSASRDTKQKGNGPIAARFSIPLKANAVVYAGGIVCTDSTGYGVPASTATGLVAIGRAVSDVDNTGGANGAKSVEVEQGLFAYANSGLDPLGIADRGGLCYLVDDQTIAKTDGGSTRSCAGTFAEIDPVTSEVWVQIGLTPNSTTALASLAALAVQLTGVQTISGAKSFAASCLKVLNAGGTFASTFTSLCSAARSVVLPDGAGTFLLDSLAQAVSGAKSFAASCLKQMNAGGTFGSTFASLASANRTVTLPDADFTVPQDSLVAHLAGAESISGAKTFADACLKQNNAGATFAHTFASAATANRVATLPDATDTLVGLAATQELSNKTLTAAVIKTGLTASGAAANDFSASTGEFKTSTGVNHILGKVRSAAATHTIADPGTGVAIPVTDSGVLMITTAAAETNSLPDPTFVGQRLTMICSVYAVGDRVVTAAHGINQANNTVMTFGAAQDFIELVGVTIGGALRWRVAANDGVALS